jgi:hypothetical protein
MTLLAGRGLRTDGTLVVVVVVVVVVRLLIHFNRDPTKPATIEDFSSASFYCRWFSMVNSSWTLKPRFFQSS